MKLPILYAFTYPDRIATSFGRIDFAACPQKPLDALRALIAESRIALAWRKGFARPAVMTAIQDAVGMLKIAGLEPIPATA